MVVALVGGSIVTASGSTGGNPTITKPSIPDGSLMVGFVTTTSGAGNTPPAPSLWLPGPMLDNDCRIDYKFAASGDPSSWTWDTPGIANAVVMFAAFSGVYTPDPFGDSSFDHLTGTGNIDLPSVDATLETLYSLQMVLKATTAANTWTPPGTVSEDADGQIAGALAFKYAIGHETLSAGASGTKTWDPSHTGSNQLFGANILLRDADAIKSAAFLGLI